MANIGFLINTKFERPDRSLVELFRDIPVSNLDDCMNRTAAVSSKVRPMNDKKLLGTAFTVKVAQGDNLMFHKAMDLAKEGDIIVIDSSETENRAIFGELMLTYCKVKGINGVIVDGPIRDLDAISKMDISVYATGASPNGPYKNGPGEIGTVISFGGKVVRPGDIIVGDKDGIIVIKPEEAEELYKKALEVMDKESGIMKNILERGQYIRPWVDELLKAGGCKVE